MAEMTREEFERMQNDAIRRVKNMQQRAASHLPPMPDYVRPLRGAITESFPEAVSNEPEPLHTPPPKSASPPKFAPPPKTISSGLGFLDKLNLKSFEMDSDRALVLMMMALLGKETADETLMLALLYIML